MAQGTIKEFDERSHHGSLLMEDRSEVAILTAKARDVASSAAVIGTRVIYNLLAEVVELPGPDLDRSLADLVDRQVLHAPARPSGDGLRVPPCPRPAHAYGRQVRDIRTATHRRCALALTKPDAAIGGEAPAVVAAHFEEGAMPREALAWWHRAAQRAAGSGANVEAIDQCSSPAHRVAPGWRLAAGWPSSR